MQMVNNQEKMHNITSRVDKINQMASKVWGSQKAHAHLGRMSNLQIIC